MMFPRFSPVRRSLLACVLGATGFVARASAQGNAPAPASPPGFVPRPRPANWPFAMTVVPCPYWANPEGEHDYYRSCHDRAIMLGERGQGRGVLWQTRQLQRWLPGGVMLADIFADAKTPQGPGQFGAYLEAARQVPGARVAPLLDVVQPDSAPLPAREDATYTQFKGFFDAFGSDARWWNVDGAPIFTDYGTGGLGVDAVGRVSARLQRDGRSFFWLSDTPGGSPLLASLDGAVDEEALLHALGNISGAFSFGSPVNYSLGGFPKAARIVRAFSSPRVFCMGTSPGLYSARGNQRNYEDARGTARMRRDLEAALVLRPDVLNAQTWNDYVEAAHVEPSYKHTSALLEILRFYGEERRGEPHPDDALPHLFVSYHKAVFAGQPLPIELLNLPVGHPFGILRGRVEIRDGSGQLRASLPFDVRGDRREAVTLSYTPPASLDHEMLDVRVAVGARSGRPLRHTFLNLPPVPVVRDGQLADPLTFTVPLHRLYSERPVQLEVDGHVRAGELTQGVPFPRLLSVVPAGLPAIEGISYERSGNIINDPVPATARTPWTDNFPDDPFHPALPLFDHYGALVQFGNGQIAYSNGLWCHDEATSAGRVWADYEFLGDGEYRREVEGKLRDRSGHGYHGTLAKVGETGTLPTWTPIAPLHDALAFDGHSAVDLPGALGFPIGPATIELLVKPAALGQPQQLLAQGGELLSLMLEADGRVRARHTNVHREFDDCLSQTRLRPNKWSSLVATFDMNRMRLYVNGRLEGEVATDGLRPNEGARLAAPFWNPNDPRRGPYQPFVGQVARLRVLQGASSPENIALDWRQLAPIYAPR